jgi:electron transport complex protein RnfE
VRELLGAGELFGVPVINNVLSIFSKNAEYVPVSIFIMAPGAFFVLAALTATQNRIKRKLEAKDMPNKLGLDTSKIQSGCNSDCAACGDSGCSRRFIDVNAPSGSVAQANKDKEEK